MGGSLKPLMPSHAQSFQKCLVVGLEDVVAVDARDWEGVRVTDRVPVGVRDGVGRVEALGVLVRLHVPLQDSVRVVECVAVGAWAWVKDGEAVRDRVGVGVREEERLGEGEGVAVSRGDLEGVREGEEVGVGVRVRVLVKVERREAVKEYVLGQLQGRERERCVRQTHLEKNGIPILSCSSALCSCLLMRKTKL